jgi:hypothetical protein
VCRYKTHEKNSQFGRINNGRTAYSDPGKTLFVPANFYIRESPVIYVSFVRRTSNTGMFFAGSIDFGGTISSTSIADPEASRFPWSRRGEFETVPKLYSTSAKCP